MRYSREVLDAVAARAKEASPDECRGMISGVRTRRGVEIVALHEFGRTCDQLTTGISNEVSQETTSPLVIQSGERSRLIERLEAAGTPVVCIYKSRAGSSATMSDEDEGKALGAEGPAHPGVEYLVLSIDDREMNTARAFRWDGRAFVGREVRPEGE